MITDTPFFRNKNYHEKTDTMETLDLNRMAKVIDGVLWALKTFQAKEKIRSRNKMNRLIFEAI